jgi:hypothetical protein
VAGRSDEAPIIRRIEEDAARLVNLEHGNRMEEVH